MSVPEAYTETPSASAPPTIASTRYVRASGIHGRDAATLIGRKIHTANAATRVGKNHARRVTSIGQPYRRPAATERTATAKIAASPNAGHASRDARDWSRMMRTSAKPASSAPATPGKKRPVGRPTRRREASHGGGVPKAVPANPSTPVELSC